MGLYSNSTMRRKYLRLLDKEVNDTITMIVLSFLRFYCKERNRKQIMQLSNKKSFSVGDVGLRFDGTNIYLIERVL